MRQKAAEICDQFWKGGTNYKLWQPPVTANRTVPSIANLSRQFVKTIWFSIMTMLSLLSPVMTSQGKTTCQIAPVQLLTSWPSKASSQTFSKSGATDPQSCQFLMQTLEKWEERDEDENQHLAWQPNFLWPKGDPQTTEPTHANQIFHKRHY